MSKSEFKPLYKRWWVKLLAIIIIFPLSFALTDYYSRGYLYYSKRAVNSIDLETVQRLFPPSGPANYFLRVVADQEYRKNHYDWKKTVQKELASVNERFTQEFGISFTIMDIAEWNPPENVREYSDLLTLAVKSINREGADILVVFTGRESQIEPGDHLVDIGVAHYLGNCLLVGDDSQLLHEMGHLFGAIDYPRGDPNFNTVSIYSYKYIKATNNIDPANHDRIMKHKYRFIW